MPAEHRTKVGPRGFNRIRLGHVPALAIAGNPDAARRKRGGATHLVRLFAEHDLEPFERTDESRGHARGTRPYYKKIRLDVPGSLPTRLHQSWLPLPLEKRTLACSFLLHLKSSIVSNIRRLASAASRSSSANGIHKRHGTSSAV